MKSEKIVIHGTTSERIANKIQQEGFRSKEGRATVSQSLIYACEWATQRKRRTPNRSETPTRENEMGRIIIMKLPPDKKVYYATHTGIEINESLKEITGYTSKYQSGKRQLAIYCGEDVVSRKKRIESAKRELKELKDRFRSFLRENNIDPDQIRSREDLIKAIRIFDIDEQIRILRQVEEFEKKIRQKRNEAEPDIFLPKGAILMSIKPTQELRRKLNELSEKIRNGNYIDLDKFTEEICEIIESDKDNFISPGLNIKEIIRDLLVTTIMTEVINIIRSLYMDVMIAKGYKIYNRGKEELKRKTVDREKLREKLERILSAVQSGNLDLGIPAINRYVKMAIGKLLRELNS
jgi:hypothetical protein